MRALSIEIYLLPGLTGIAVGDSVLLVDRPGGRARLCSSEPVAERHLQRRNAAGLMVSQAFMGGASPPLPAQDRFEALLNEAKPLRPAGSDGLFLVVECEKTLADRPLQHVIDCGDVAWSMDPAVEEEVGTALHHLRNAALSALALAGFEGVAHDARSLGSTDVVYADGSDRPTYILTMKASATITMRSSLLPEQAEEAAILAAALDTAPKSLRHVPRLLAYSHEQRLMPLPAFISAWAGLEILIAASFSAYETVWSASLLEGVASGPQTVLRRMREVMKDKYRLADKFALVAGALDGPNAENDIATFSRLKSIRDGFFHTLTTQPSDLPGEETRRLLKKYLALHLKGSFAG